MKTCPQCSLRYPDETTFCFIDGATLESAGSGPEGRTLGGLFFVESLIAKGRWSAVYRARFRLVEGECVVKLMADPIPPDRAAAFTATVKRARRFDHPNVLAPWTGGVTPEGLAYVARASFAGTTLTEQMAGRALPVERVLPIAAQLLRGLCRIHDFGGAHGDLRPDNVLVARDGSVRLLDAAHGRSTYRELWDPQADVADTLSYLAPELVPGGARRAELDPAGNAASAAADLYALGAVVFRLLTGRTHVEAATVDDLRTKLAATGGPAPSALLDVPLEGLGGWVDDLLDQAVASRLGNSHQALLDLEKLAEGAGIALPSLDSSAAPESIATATALASLFQRWDRYASIFKTMMEIGFPAGASGQAKLSYDLIGGKVADLRALGQQAQTQHGTLAGVYRRASEGRQRIAEQMTELASKIRLGTVDSRPAERDAAAREAALAAFPPRFAEQHRELIRWEGRSGLREPYRELAEAYRALADLVDEWWKVRSEQAESRGEIDQKRARIAETVAQLEELRKALDIHESNIEAEIEAYERSLAEMTERLDTLEPDLLDQATRFTAPLRSKPELGSCFRELQQVGA